MSEASSLDELQSLAKSAGYIVVHSLEQVTKENPRYQIGAGKVKELAELVGEYKAERIIFDNELKPVQAYNLAKETGVEAIDRFQLILEIFAKRASTSEAKLQIQLAKLRYELPRAKEKVKLARMVEQPGFMGLGKYEADPYYENVRRGISSIREKLKRIRRKRRLHRAHRLELGFSSVSLAGYTNAGKSSLFNALAEEATPVDAGLFTTLSTTTRVANISKTKILLTDTVGFIDRLPLTLIEAFQSTLEEAIFSDLILLVVDVSEPPKMIEDKLSCCLDTIQKIGATEVPVITVLNKVDLLSTDEKQQRIEAVKDLAPNPIPVSARFNTNTQLLKQEMLGYLKDSVHASFSLPISNETMSFLSWLFNQCDVSQVQYEGDDMHVVFESIPWFAEKVKGKVEQLNGSFNMQNPK
jgi:GTP-binding protein HflX